MLRAPESFEGFHSQVGASLSFEKGPDAMKRPASMGNGRADLAAWFDKGSSEMRSSTRRPRGQTFVPRTDVRPILHTSVPVMAPALDEKEAAERFSALVLEYSRGDLAKASDRTKEAAKHWKEGTRAPNCSSLITMARRIPRIRDWVIDQIDTPESVQADGPDAISAVMVGLQLAANLPGQQGAMARAMLKKFTEGG